MVTSFNNYPNQYKRIAHLADDQMKALHTYLQAETENFQDWSELVDDPQLEKTALAHFKAVDALLKKVVVDKGYSGNKFEGRSYQQTKDLGVVEIAKLIRKELAIEFPGCEFTVTTDKFSGGQSIDTRILSIDFDPLSEDLTKWLASGKTYSEFVNDRSYFNGSYSSRPQFNKAYERFEDKVKAIVAQYKMDDSDSMTDYFHTNFYGQVSSLNVPEYLKTLADPNYKANQKAAAKAERDAQKKGAAEREKKRQELYGNFKKGELAFFKIHYDSKPGYWKAGDLLLCKILTVPNGRSRYGSNYKIRLYLPVDNKGVKHRTGSAPAVSNAGVDYYYYNDYDYGSKDNLVPLSAAPKPKKKASPTRKTAVRKAATTKKAAKGSRAAVTQKRLGDYQAKQALATVPKKSRESIVETLATVRKQVKKSLGVKAKIRSRVETGKDSTTKRRTATAPVATAAKPKKATTPRKVSRTPKNVQKRIERLEATVAKQRKELGQEIRLIKKIHRQTKR
jgi:hypothetical protein